VERRLPTGTVTFLFTDIEGSTKLLDELGEAAYERALAEHRSRLRVAFARHGGVEVDTQGDAFFYAFSDAAEALAAAAEGQAALREGPIKVRIGLHSGQARVSGEGYVGRAVHRGARIAAAGHGGQVLISEQTRELLGAGNTVLLELGEHRLKDFAEPVAIFQLGERGFPPLKTISNTNLPRPASSFVGREHEVDEVTGMLENGARLLTLTGPGGSGKTRLALEVAAELVPRFKAGVFWVGLAPLRDAALVPETIAQTLGAKDGLVEHIGERELLLLLDNLEQVVAAAPELASLVEACPNLRMLVTSRELLRVRGEVEYAVPPLAEPEAVELFCQRSGLEADETIAELCRRLDNLPLAVELAAARTNVLSPVQILERLSKRLDLLKGGRDAEARQQTLRAAIEWSHDLLDEQEQKLFARLSVFRGGCTLEAAEQVAHADLDVLQSLVDKSLVRHSEERFWMLETIREYAAERLVAGEAAKEVSERHLNYFLELAERAYEERLTANDIWFPILEAELDNLRSALDWATASEPRVEAQLAGAIADTWMVRGHAPEARERLAGAVARYDNRDSIRARALTHLGELDDDLATLEQGLSLWRELGDARGEGLALEAIGWTHDYQGDYVAAQEAHEASLSVRRRAGIRELEGAPARAGLCHVLVASGEVDRAEAMAHKLLEVAAEPRMKELALHFLADCPLVSGHYAEAERRYLRALSYAHSAGLPGRAVDEVVGVAMSLSGQGQFSRAVRLAEAAYVKQEELGMGTDRWWKTMQEWFIGGARAQLSADERAAAELAGNEAGFDAVLKELLGSQES